MRPENWRPIGPDYMEELGDGAGLYLNAPEHTFWCSESMSRRRWDEVLPYDGPEDNAMYKMMYKIVGMGYVGPQRVPVAIDYIVWAAGYEDAIRRVRQLGIMILQCTVNSVGQH